MLEFMVCTKLLSAKGRKQSENAEMAKYRKYTSGAQFEGDLGEILALGAEISPYIGLREKWESP